MKILIVEDTPTLIAIVRVYLMRPGVEFLEAPNGQAGLELARQHLPAVIISDLEMPLLDGLELCASVRRDPDLAKTPFILLTSHDDEVSKRKGRLVGATAFLVKPVAPKELRARVAEACGLKDGWGERK